MKRQQSKGPASIRYFKPRRPHRKVTQLTRQCGAKVFYLSYGEARNAAYAVTRTAGIGVLHPYKCEFCTGYHIGHRGSK